MMERNKAIDITKGLGILMITYGHITELSNPVDTWMSLFKISLFFIVAGYIMAASGNVERRTTRESVVRILRSTMIPYVSFSIISASIRAVAAFLKSQDVLLSLKTNLWAIVSLRGISTLWFLPVLAFAEIVFVLLIKSKAKGAVESALIWPIIVGVIAEQALVIMQGSLSATKYTIVSYPFLFVSKSLVSVWFLAVGYKAYPLLQKVNSVNAKLVIGIILSLITAFIATFFNPHIDFNMMRLGEPFALFFIGGVTGTFGAFLVFERVSHLTILMPFDYFGKNSLLLMIVQRAFLLINFLLSGWKATIGLPEEVCAKYFLETICVLVLVLLISYAFIEIINKSSTLSMVLLGKKRKAEK